MKPTPNKLIDLTDKSEVIDSLSTTANVTTVAVIPKDTTTIADSTGNNDTEGDTSIATIEKRTPPESNVMPSASATRLHKVREDGLGVCDGLMLSRGILNKDEVA